VDGLNRVDDERGGAEFLDLGEDAFDRRFGEEADVIVDRAESSRAERDLARRFFARDVEHDAVIRELRGDLQEERRLTDPRLAADERDRAEHQAAAEHAVEALDVRRHARRAIRADVPDRHRRRARAQRLRMRRSRRRIFLRVRVPGIAIRTTPQPLRRLSAAFGAGVDNGFLGHL